MSLTEFSCALGHCVCIYLHVYLDPEAVGRVG